MRPLVVRAARTTFASFVTLIAVVVLPAAPVRGDPPSAVGWWTSENPGLPAEPVPSLVPSGGPVSALPSDIPPGGFEVANVGTVQSYAAISYDAYGGYQATKVILKIHQSAANLPKSQVQLCPLTGSGSFPDAHGEPLALGPPYDCTTAVPAVADASGSTVSFAVQSLMRGSRLAVAVVAVGTSRLVFEPADDKTIVVAPGSDSTAVPAPNAADDTSAALPSPLAGTAPVASPPPVVSSGPPAPIAAPAAASSPAPATAQPARPASLVAVTSPAGTSGAGSAVVGAVILLFAAVSITVRNRRARLLLPQTTE